jgi:hypothetical protein
MKKLLVAVAATLLLVGVASAQVHFEFHCTGTGNMVQDEPIIYGGQIDGGDLAPGAWQMDYPTSVSGSWPAPGGPTDPNGRWAHIFTNYYVYDPGPRVWTGFFDNFWLYLEKTGQGSMQGTCDMTYQIIDMDGDGVLDPNECMDGLSGAVIIIQDGTGIYVNLCGDGTYEGFYFRDCVLGNPTYMLDQVDFNMQLDLEDCAMANEASTWGAVKALFE